VSLISTLKGFAPLLQCPSIQSCQSAKKFWLCCDVPGTEHDRHHSYGVGAETSATWAKVNITHAGSICKAQHNGNLVRCAGKTTVYWVTAAKGDGRKFFLPTRPWSGWQL
jgi:hypothetical protein